MNLNVECSAACVTQATPVAQMAATTPTWDPAFRTEAARYDLIITASSLSILRFQAGSAGTGVAPARLHGSHRAHSPCFDCGARWDFFFAQLTAAPATNGINEPQ